MTREQAVEEAKQFYALAMQAASTGDVGALRAVMTQETMLRAVLAANMLAEDVEQMIGELAEGPTQRLIESFWLHTKTIGVLTTVNNVLGEASVPEPPQPTPSIGALDDVMAKALQKK